MSTTKCTSTLQSDGHEQGLEGGDGGQDEAEAVLALSEKPERRKRASVSIFKRCVQIQIVSDILDLVFTV